MCAQVFAWTLAYSGVEVVRWTSSWLIVQHHKMTQPGNVKKLALQQWMLASSGVEVARWTTDSGLATAMVAYSRQSSTGWLFFLGWRLFDGRQWFWTRYGNGRISSRQSTNGCLLLLGWRLIKGRRMKCAFSTSSMAATM